MALLSVTAGVRTAGSACALAMLGVVLSAMLGSMLSAMPSSVGPALSRPKVTVASARAVTAGVVLEAGGTPPVSASDTVPVVLDGATAPMSSPAEARTIPAVAAVSRSRASVSGTCGATRNERRLGSGEWAEWFESGCG